MKRFIQSMILVLLCLLFCSPALAQSVPYTIKLKASAAIYQGNSVHYGYVKSVGTAFIQSSKKHMMNMAICGAG